MTPITPMRAAISDLYEQLSLSPRQQVRASELSMIINEVAGVWLLQLPEDEALGIYKAALAGLLKSVQLGHEMVEAGTL